MMNNKRLVNIDLYIIDCFEMTVKSFNGSLRHIRCDQTFQRTRTSTVSLPLEELLNSMDLVNQVADMFIHADYGFTMFTERISKFIHKEARAGLFPSIRWVMRERPERDGMRRRERVRKAQLVAAPIRM
ncbi:hypothetical protein QJS10_CPA06g01473 [Acorus calamus]|uniref:Uncharacterized protein n=1 Tax=Acorus calamus TaxID=4465 RepID=A0AAV9EJC0_ACOCL|nr:hypothetical protein QJS10_CPA06g01473 [Acorus calamus]